MSKKTEAQPTLPSDLVAVQEAAEDCLNLAIRLIQMARIRNLTAELAIELVSSLKGRVAEAKVNLAKVSSDLQREGAPIGIVLTWLQLQKSEVGIFTKGPLRGVTFHMADMSEVKNTVIQEIVIGQHDEEILGKRGLAVEAAIEFSKKVYESCCLVAHPLNNLPIHGCHRKLDPACIGQEFDSVLNHLRSMALPDLRRVRFGINDEISHAAKKRIQNAGPYSDRSSEAHRLTFNDSTYTIIFDQVPYDNLDPTSYNVFKGIHRLQDNTKKAISAAELYRLPGLRGKTIGREIRKLPKELQDLVGSKSGAGRWIAMPPL